MTLENKVVVIVGGSQGLGKALAEGLIKEGARVVIVSKHKDRVDETAHKIGAVSFVADVRNEQNLRDVAKAVYQKFGSIDIWVNSAGVFRVFPKDRPIDMDRAHEVFDVNFFGTVFGSVTALSFMREKGGSIINILSSAALDATRAKNAALYAASKWAVRGYVEALRGDNAYSNIKIYSVYPGGMKTHFHDETLPADFENFMDPVSVAGKVIENLKQPVPENDLVIKRPSSF